MSKLSDIATSQNTLITTQANLAAHQTNISDQLAEISSNQSELSQNQQSLAERMLDVEHFVLDQVDRPLTNPDFPSLEEEVMTSTGIALTTLHLSSRPPGNNPVTSLRMNRFESRTIDYGPEASGASFFPRRSSRIRERQLTQSGFESHRPITSSSTDLPVAAGVSYKPNMVARKGEASNSSEDLWAGTHMATERPRQVYTSMPISVHIGCGISKQRAKQDAARNILELIISTQNISEEDSC